MKKSKRSIFVENKMKLLLIEDDINACEIFKKIERARKEIEFIKITNSETEGLKCVKQNAPEGIILDLELTMVKEVDLAL
jgi:response regulator of citrate/malate metabolism